VTDDRSPAVGAVATEPKRTRRRTTVVVRPEACVACGACVEACPRGAIGLDEVATIDAGYCTGCGICVETCAYDALELEVT
jgi:ferredoxin